VDANIRAFEIGRVLVHDSQALAQLLDDGPREAIGVDETLDMLADRLTRYQDAAYAKRFRDRIASLSGAFEARDRAELVLLAAKSLHKMMAIKDEYEVARHLTSAEFTDEIARNFGGNYRISYHLAPPILTRARDARGRPRKRAFGPWLAPLLRGLARAKRVRGTWADPFAYTADRRHDYAALTWFKDVLDRIETRAGELPPQMLAEILRAPMDIRGYGPVRDEALRSVQKRVADLLA
jgi:indolepyruvate ferredoxin oxidoreductase